MGALRDFELAGWQSAASTYDGFAGATRLFVPALVQAAGAEPGMRLLDIACGTGVAAQAAADAGARVTGLDFSPAMLVMARSLHPGIDFHAGDAEALPFADARFDAAIANFGIHHVERPERAIADARRVLKRGGTFAFTVWAASAGQHGLAHHLRCREGVRPPRCPDAGRKRLSCDAGELLAARNRSGIRCRNAHQRTADVRLAAAA